MLTAQIQFQIDLLDDQSTYEVSYVPIVDWNVQQTVTNTSQVVIAMPSGGFDVSTANIVNLKGTWAVGSPIVRQPAENPTMDYIYFNLQSPIIGETFQADVAIPLFQFTNSGSCTGALELMDNVNDPFLPPNSLDLNIGQQVGISGAGPGVNGYERNINLGAANCNLPDCEIVINYIDFTSPTACGVADGTITISARNGTGVPLQFTINDGLEWVTDTVFTGLSAGRDYNIGVRDAIAICEVDGGVVRLRAPLAAAVSPTDISHPSACGASDGQITINATTENSAPLEYSIDGGQSYQTPDRFTGLAGGRYDLYVRNNQNNCEVSAGEVTLVDCDGGGPVACQVEYQIIHQSDGKYVVSLIPADDYPGPANRTDAGRVTIKVPTGGFQVENLTMLVNGVNWQLGARFDAPAEAADFDYINVDLASAGTQNIIYQADQRVDLFSFENSAICVQDSVALMDNEEDPYASANSDVGQQLILDNTGVTGLKVCVALAVPAPNHASTLTVNTTDESCDGNDGVISMLVDNGVQMEYSIDNGTTWGTAGTISDATAGDYNIMARELAHPACVLTYENNPVTISQTTDCTPTACTSDVIFHLDKLSDGRYQIALTPNFTYGIPLNTTSTMNITVRVPTGGFQVADLTSLITGVSFAVGGRYNAPAEAPNFDYIIFRLTSTATRDIFYSAGIKTPLFTFNNGGGCVGNEVELTPNDSDPFYPPNSESAASEQAITILGAGDAIAACVENLGASICEATGLVTETHTQTISRTEPTEICLQEYIDLSGAIGTVSVDPSVTDVSVGTEDGSDCVLITPSPNFDSNIEFYVLHCDASDGNICDTTYISLCPAIDAGQDRQICLGQPVQLAATGGSGTFSWSPTDGLSCTDCSNPMADPAVSTTYTVTNNDGICNSSDEVRVNVLVAPIAGFTNTTVCAGELTTFTDASNSSRAVTGWFWDFDDNSATSADQNPTHTFSAGGDYNVTLRVQTQDGCIGEIMQTVTVTGTPTITAVSEVDADDCSTANGIIEIVASGNDLEYSIDNGNVWAGSGRFIDLDAGDYNILVRERNSTCVATHSANPVTIQSPAAPAVTTPITDQSVCVGEVVPISISLDTDIMSYQITTNGDFDTDDATLNTLMFNALATNATNDFTVEFTVAGGCTVSENFIITQKSQPVASFTATDAACGSGDVTLTFDGTANTNATLTWDVGTASVVSSSAATATAPAGAIYVVNWATNGDQTVSLNIDQEGCIDQTDQTVTVAASTLQITAVATDIDECDAANGEVNLTVSGNAADYTYAWTGPNSFSATTQNLSDLTTGTYSVVVTQTATGCTANASATVNSTATPFTINLDKKDISLCGADNGEIVVQLDGDPGNYSFDWTGDNDFTASTQTISGLAAGNYSVVVTETGSGCSATASATIVAPIDLELVNVSKTDTDGCGEPNGTISIEISGGTAPYTYDLAIGVVLVTDSGNQTAYTFTDVAENTYQVHVTDANGCSVTEEVEIITNNDNAPQLALTDQIDANCGETVGSINAAVTNGNAPFTYTLFVGDEEVSEESSSANEFLFSNLAANNYRLVLTDDNGCTAEETFTIAGGNALANVTINPTDPDCYRQNGIVRLRELPSDATVIWYDANDVEIDRDINVLTDVGEGTYRALITASGCEITLEATIASEGCLEFTTDTLRITLDYETEADICVDMQVESDATPTSVDVCGFNNQQLEVTQVEGSDYCFNLNPADEYFGVAEPVCVVHCFEDQGVTICDTTIIAVTVNAPEDVVCDVVIRGMFTNRATCESPNGSARVEMEGSPVDFRYEWSTGATGTAEIDRVTPGEYIITVTEIATECFVVDTFLVGNIPAPTATLTATDTNCDGTGGAVNLAIEGGSPPFQITWVGAATGLEQDIMDTSFDLTDLPAGDYTIEVQDIYNCSSMMDITVNQPTSDLSLAVNTMTAVDCENVTGSATIDVSGFNTNYQLTLNDEALTDFTDQSTVELAGLAAGDYTLNIQDASSCTSTLDFTIADEGTLELTEAAVTAAGTSCADATDGGISSASDAVYTIRTAGGETIGQTPQTELAAGSYFVIQTEGACTDSINVTIEAGEGISLAADAITIANTSCGDATDGGITSATDAVYTIRNAAGETLGETPVTDLAAGTYTVVFTQGACADSITVDVEMTTELEFTMAEVSVENISCNGETDGSISAAGDVAFMVRNSNDEEVGMTPQMGLSSGTYTLVKTDGDCSATLEVVVLEPLIITAEVDSRPESCEGNNGSISLTVTGGTENYTFAWSNDISDSEVASNLSIGTDYAVTITDESGCVLELAGIEVTSICDEIPCDPVFSQNLIEMESEESMVAVCLPVGETDLADYDLILNGENLNLTLTECTDGQSVELANPATHELIIIAADDCADTITIVLTQPIVEAPCDATVMDETVSLDTKNCEAQADYCLPISDLTNIEIRDNGTLLANDFMTCNTGFSIPLMAGTHELIITDTLNSCMDTVNVTVNGICNQTRDTLFLEIDVDEMQTVCPDTSQLLSTHILTDLDCFDNSTNNADFTMTEDDCIEVTGVAGGMDEICIIICDNTGICDTNMLVVTVTQDSIVDPGNDDFVIHTGFSPNDDGINDKFTIQNIEDFPNSTLVVYNRWGLRVYRSDNYNNNEAWEGTFEQQLLPDGVYYYFLDRSDGERMFGSITLRR
ncbi:MAG: gliding motility-associated C-terminal domain-containing protein [Saprospiraceae bacterium]